MDNCRLVLTEYNNKKVSFIYEDGILAEAHFFNNESIKGNIYAGRVKVIDKNIGSAFIDIGEKNDVYYIIPKNDRDILYIDRIGSKAKDLKKRTLKEGDEIVCMISRDAYGTKRAKATAKIDISDSFMVTNLSGNAGFSSRLFVGDHSKRKDLLRQIKIEVDRFNNGYEGCEALPCRLGVIARTSVGDKDIDEIRTLAERSMKNFSRVLSSAKNRKVPACLYRNEDAAESYIDEITARYQGIGVKTEVKVDYEGSSIFTRDTVKKYEKYCQKIYYLKSGAFIITEKTEAFTVIDVNSGVDLKGDDVQKTFLRVNLEALDEIMHMIRIRNITGAILIDFISMTDPSFNSKLTKEIRRLCALDPHETHFVDLTKLGIAELTRKA